MDVVSWRDCYYGEFFIEKFYYFEKTLYLCLSHIISIEIYGWKWKYRKLFIFHQLNNFTYGKQTF
jgi:hypothetical protein